MRLTRGMMAMFLSVALLGSAHAARHNSLQPAGRPSHPLTLADGGETDYVIVIPAQPTSQEQKAADDLALWLGAMTDAEFRIVPDSAAAIETEISVGRTNRLLNASVPQAGGDLGDEGYAIGVRGSRLFLVGGRKRGPNKKELGRRGGIAARGKSGRPRKPKGMVP